MRLRLSISVLGDGMAMATALAFVALCLRTIWRNGDKQNGRQENQPCRRAEERTLHPIHINPPSCSVMAGSDPLSRNIRRKVSPSP